MMLMHMVMQQAPSLPSEALPQLQRLMTSKVPLLLPQLQQQHLPLLQQPAVVSAAPACLLLQSS
jgi:hypothetical protein